MLMLLFQIGEDRYALGAAEVVEVIPSIRLRRIPHAPDFVDGYFSYRGTYAPVIDLSWLISSRPSNDHLSTRIILVRSGGSRGKERLIGLRAEQVTDTLKLREEEFADPPLEVPSAPYLGPVASTPAGVVQRLRVEALVTASLSDALFAEISGRP